MATKMKPYALYLPDELHAKLKVAARKRQAATVVRDALSLYFEKKEPFAAGYAKGLEDAAKVVYDCEEAQMVAVNGKDIGAVLSDLILSLKG